MLVAYTERKQNKNVAKRNAKLLIPKEMGETETAMQKIKKNSLLN